MTMHVGVGVMSGTSLDGLDMCCVEFVGDEEADNWKYSVLCSKTASYTAAWRERLATAHLCGAEELLRLHVDYGHHVGELLAQFMDENKDIDDIRFIAPHGHTIFHQPQNKFTFQLGDGETMASHVRVPLVTNFRSKDVGLGGQGAPLVYIGERHLFAECNMFLNLGGISNISVGGKSFDIAPCNMMLNFLAQKLNPAKVFDDKGKVAESGTVIEDVLDKLNRLEYYKYPPPKSLGREWFEKAIVPLLDAKSYSVPDLLRTAVEHITDQVCHALTHNTKDTSDEPVRLENTLLVTGGGALNTFLFKTLCAKIAQLPIPITVWDADEDVIRFKEAIIFSFLGLRTLLGLPNTCSEVTGASMDAVSGSIHLPPDGNILLPHLNKTCPFHIMRKISRASVNSYGSTEVLGVPEGLTAPQAMGLNTPQANMYEKPVPLRDRTLTH